MKANFPTGRPCALPLFLMITTTIPDYCHYYFTDFKRHLQDDPTPPRNVVSMDRNIDIHCFNF